MFDVCFKRAWLNEVIVGINQPFAFRRCCQQMCCLVQWPGQFYCITLSTEASPLIATSRFFLKHHPTKMVFLPNLAPTAILELAEKNTGDLPMSVGRPNMRRPLKSKTLADLCRISIAFLQTPAISRGWPSRKQDP